MHSDNNVATLQVLVCHEAPLVNAGIAALLEGLTDITVTRNAGVASAPWRDICFHVVVADYTSGLLCARDPGGFGPGRPHERQRVLIVTSQGSEWEIRHAIAGGVRGYLLADCEGHALQRAVRAVASGARCFDDVVSSRIAESLTHATLTQREHEVLCLLTGGCCNKTIAARLGIAVGTVKAHVKAILEKMHVRTRMQAAALANERGMLRVPPPTVTGSALRGASTQRRWASGAPGF